MINQCKHGKMPNMQRVYPKSQLSKPLDVLRKAGYTSSLDPVTGESSYMLRLSGQLYPRFHLYVTEQANNVSLNLHLDQKQPSYGQGHKHSGEYDGPIIEKEMRRLDGWIKASAVLSGANSTENNHGQAHPASSNLAAELKRWWRKIFKAD